MLHQVGFHYADQLLNFVVKTNKFTYQTLISSPQQYQHSLDRSGPFLLFTMFAIKSNKNVLPITFTICQFVCLHATNNTLLKFSCNLSLGTCHEICLYTFQRQLKLNENNKP